MNTRFIYKLTRILSEQGRSLYRMEREAGVSRGIIYRGIKRKSTLCAIAYYVGMTVEELIEDTEMEDVWYQ